MGESVSLETYKGIHRWNQAQNKEPGELYGFAKGRTVSKQLDAFEQHAIRYIELSPFVVISSVGNGDLDSSPRGGA